MKGLVRLSALAVGVATVVGACGSDASQSPLDPGSPDVFDPQHLLSDRELETPEDPAAPPENPAWTAWAIENHEPIRSIQADDFSDLEFLKSPLADKRIVQLGESGHGVREFNHLKVRLVKFLHQELGFNVLAFESSMFECTQADSEVLNVSARETLENCAFAVWHTEEVRALFDYIRETRSTSRPLRLTGIDTQISAEDVAQTRPRFFHDLIDPFEPALADTVEALDTEFLDNYTRTLAGQYIYLIANRRRLTGWYTRIAEFLDGRGPEFEALGPEWGDRARLGSQTARSMIAFTTQLSSESDAIIEARDLGMADNLSFVREQQYPGEKIVVWAHNFHVRHANEQVSPLPAPRTMGGWLKERYDDEMYSFGLYTYQGVMADNGRRVYAVGPAASGSVESILYRPRRRWLFVDLASAPVQVQGTGWIHGEATAMAWGTNPLTMVPREQYDGLLFVHTVSAPAYLN